MSKLMDYVGAKGSVVNVIALNDYSTVIPFSDFRKYNAILALKINGEYMSIRDKGPSFIVYPYDSLPELNNQIYYSRSAWQVREGANKQVISSQADSLIKISRIWADFSRKHIESAYLGYFFHHFWRYFRFLLRSLPLTYHLVHPKQVGQGE
jgi:hypothetical protein